jgi:hypothetical protein
MTSEEALILKKLDQLYENHHKTGPIILNTDCSVCGVSVRVEIYKTSSGYGINDGSIFLMDDRLSAKCI